MSMYIDTYCKDVYSDDRLEYTVKKLTALSIKIQDAEWDGEDVTAMRQQLHTLKQQHGDGVEFTPRF
jgi:hypothetical protein